MLTENQEQSTDLTSFHPFQKLNDIDLNGDNIDLYGPSSPHTVATASSSRSSSSCSNSSKHTKMTAAEATAAYEQHQRQSKAPRVNIIVDQQPEYLGYGESIFGRLYIDTNGVPSTTRVKNLRVSIFGNARVHGDHPDQPLSQGLFDYKKDAKVLSTGVRIVKRGAENNSEPFGLSPFLTSEEQKEQQQQQKAPARKRSKDKGRMIDPDDFDIHTTIHHDEEQEGVVYSGENNGDQLQGINNHITSNNKVKSSPSSSKQARDKAIEQLMERIALCAPSNESVSSHGMALHILNAPQMDQEEEEKSYDLEPSKNHRIRFSIPITTRRLLPGSLDHKNYPIHYHIVALLIYTTDNNPTTHSVSHIVVPLNFKPTPINTFQDTDEELLTARQKTNPVSIWITNSKLDQILLSVKTKQAVKTMPPPPSSPVSSIMDQNINTFSRSENINNNSLILQDHANRTWVARLLHHLSYYYVQRCRVLTTPYLKCSLELPHKIFSQGDAIPLRVHVENTGLDISQVIIESKLKQRLYMTYHCGELAESKLINQATTLFTENDPIQLVPVSTTSNNNNNNDQSSIRSSAKDSGMELKWDSGSDDINSATISNSIPPPIVGVESSNLCSSRNIVFDLTKVLYVSDQCTHTVLPEMTKGIFEISYELQVAVSVIGSRIISTTREDNTHQSFFYASADQHFSRSSITRNKGYLLKPPSIPIVIGSEQKLI